ncbi:MAG: hypothetical protein QG646_1894 [Euryarchaeota archaeon]|nr:hypothetical protein [Euryarchaeota archaeon]
MNLKVASLSDDKIRVPGGGRKKVVDKDPTVVSDLETLIEPTSRGDPEYLYAEPL